ncbi:uncharacterized protein LOC111322602 [Stylophora pistillata]|uniref:uncharacterized protein LOC111322602 n=1 Tax=Stylophora pistillata TaxID=50429 RepID=UPI000C0469F2|nr:uncharacterized protein LOC111322602 [Stylophora pistillata]
MSFITIHFGENQKLFFNLLCPTVILYKNIKLRCGCEEKAVIDIADENGCLKTIYERPPDQYASQYLQGRGNFVLLKVLRKIDSASGKEVSSFVPLLNNVAELYPDLMAKVHNYQINPDVGLPEESISQIPPLKSSQQARSKATARGVPSMPPRSPASRAGSTGGAGLPSVTKIRSSLKVSK